jgi:hypothetical protein
VNLVRSRIRVYLVTVLACFASAPAAGAAPAADCSAEAQVLSRDQADLPRLDIASPADRPPYCITLETVMAFAGRVKAHVAHCPKSDYAPTMGDWDKTQTDYLKLFSRYRCKRTR